MLRLWACVGGCGWALFILGLWALLPAPTCAHMRPHAPTCAHMRPHALASARFVPLVPVFSRSFPFFPARSRFSPFFPARSRFSFFSHNQPEVPSAHMFSCTVVGSLAVSRRGTVCCAFAALFGGRLWAFAGLVGAFAGLRLVGVGACSGAFAGLAGFVSGLGLWVVVGSFPGL